jgi:hypothetical protein
MDNKFWAGVSEEHENDGVHWFVELGQPNAELKFEVENKEKAFEIQEILREYFNQS